MKYRIGIRVHHILVVMLMGIILLMAGCETTLVETEGGMANQRSSQHVPSAEPAANGERTLPAIPAPLTSLKR